MAITTLPANLDAESVDALWTFWSRVNAEPVRAARSMLGTNRPKGYVAAVHALGNYAANKATAIQCRLRGDISGALMYEDIADCIYDKLPSWARW